MKIGIVSNYEWLLQWDNYGTLLQNYALQRVLQSDGHETFWILTTNQGPGRYMAKARNALLKAVHEPRELGKQVAGVLKGTSRNSPITR